MRTDNLSGGELEDLLRRVRALERATPLNNASIGRNGLRVHDGGKITIENNGGLTITGPDGELIGNGTLDWTGLATLTGTTNLNGPTQVDGTLGVSGATILASTLTVNSAGKIVVGNLTLDPVAGTGGAITAVSNLKLNAPTVLCNAALTVTTGFYVGGNSEFNGNLHVTGVKSFRIDHPTKPGMYLQHASTESPVSGTEYWGTGKFKANGECIVTLPSYFEDLNKPNNRVVLVSSIGKPFPVGADEIVSGKFTVYGESGRRFSWLVKAERIGADFDVEYAKPLPED